MRIVRTTPELRSRRARGWSAFCVGACLVTCGAASSTANAASLQSLFNGGSVEVGNSRFSHWELISLASTSSPSVDLSLIDVVGNLSDPERPAIQFNANGQLSTAGVRSLDLLMRFRVTALAGANSFVGHELEMTGISYAAMAETAFISAEAFDAAAAAIDPVLTTIDTGSGFVQLADYTSYLPKSQVTVVMNVFLAGTAMTSMVDLFSFSHRVDQTGPAGLVGDYNQNGHVDAADYILWRNLEGETGPGHAADGDGDDDVDGDDYDLWRANFGATLGSASGSDTSPAFTSALPEPASGVLLLLGPMAYLFRSRTRG